MLRELRETGGSATGRVFRRLVPRRETVKADFEAAEIPRFDDHGRKADFHSLRHTCNMLLLRAGVDERTRQQFMRHRTARVTNQQYTDARRLPLREAASAIPALLTLVPQIVPRAEDASCLPKSRAVSPDRDRESRNPLNDNDLRHDESSRDANCRNAVFGHENWRRGESNDHRLRFANYLLTMTYET